jgi:hypothetical protein
MKIGLHVVSFSWPDRWKPTPGHRADAGGLNDPMIDERNGAFVRRTTGGESRSGA